MQMAAPTIAVGMVNVKVTEWFGPVNVLADSAEMIVSLVGENHVDYK